MFVKHAAGIEAERLVDSTRHFLAVFFAAYAISMAGMAARRANLRVEGQSRMPT